MKRVNVQLNKEELEKLIKVMKDEGLRTLSAALRYCLVKASKKK